MCTLRCLLQFDNVSMFALSCLPGRQPVVLKKCPRDDNLLHSSERILYSRGMRNQNTTCLAGDLTQSHSKTQLKIDDGIRGSTTEPGSQV